MRTGGRPREDTGRRRCLHTEGRDPGGAASLPGRCPLQTVRPSSGVLRSLEMLQTPETPSFRRPHAPHRPPGGRACGLTLSPTLTCRGV